MEFVKTEILGSVKVTCIIRIEPLTQSGDTMTNLAQQLAELKTKKENFSKVEDALFAQVSATTRAAAFSNFPALCAALDTELQTGVSNDQAAKAVAAVQAEWLALAPGSADAVGAIVQVYNLALAFLALVPTDAVAPAPTPAETPSPVVAPAAPETPAAPAAPAQ